MYPSSFRSRMHAFPAHAFLISIALSPKELCILGDLLTRPYWSA